MKKAINTLVVLLLFTNSCTLVEKPSPAALSPYSVSFSRLNDLAAMKRGRYGMGYTTDGTYLYAVNGSSKLTFYATDVWRYDIASDEWSVLTDGLTPKRYVSAEYVAGKIYVLGGYGPSGEINPQVEVIDPFTGSINHTARNPSPVSFPGSAVWKDKIYVFGGTIFDENYFNRLYVFDPIRVVWKQLPGMPEYKHAPGEIVDGVLYVFGGYNGQVSARIDAYDIVTNNWSYLGDMPVGISANAITKHGKFIWLVGSYNKLSQLAVFNTETREFNLVKSNLFGRRHAAAEVVDDKLYVFGGTRASRDSFLSSIQVADITAIEGQLSPVAPDGDQP